MKLETFFEKFEMFADAPNAVAKMRELVLTLAVQGKLVPQEPNDELAEWPTVSMKEVCDLITDGEHATPQRVSSGVPLATAKNVRDGFLDMAQTDYVAPETAVKCWRRCKPKHGDILMVCVGATTGRVCLVTNPPDMVLVRSVALLRPNMTRIEGRFLDLFLRSPSGQTQIWGGVRQNAQPCLYLGKMSEFTIPLPPLAEQKRIVAKVNELMALCDRLEAEQQKREEKHKALSRASLARFADAPTPANLQFIFHPSYDIAPADLRKTILTLAVQGKLAPEIKTRHVALGEVIHLISGQHLLANEQNEAEKGIPYLTGPSDFGARHPKATRWTETPKVVAEPGDILITVKGSGVGKTNKLIAERTAISRQLMAVRVTGADPDFVHLVLMNAAGYFQESMTGIAIPGIGRKDVLELEVELPPLAEQRRIVAKVEELMKLVDALETQLAASRTTAANLLSAIVAELTNKG